MKFCARKPNQEQQEEDETEYTTINLSLFNDLPKIKNNVVITVIDTVTDSIIDHCFSDPIEKDSDRVEFKEYHSAGVWELVNFMYMHKNANPTIKDVFLKYDGEVIFVGGDSQYYEYRRECLPESDFRLMVVTTY